MHGDVGLPCHPRRADAESIATIHLLAEDDIVPIPGSKHRSCLEENEGAVEVRLTVADLHEIDAIAPRGGAAGPRYPPAGMATINR